MLRRFIILFVSVASLFAIVTGIQGQDPVNPLYKTETGFIKFVSDAPLEFINAESNHLKGVVDISQRTFAFRLEVNTLKGFNSPLQQEHFYENYMETEQYPAASFQGKIIENIDVNTTRDQTIRAKGLLNIHGVQQERIIKCKIKIEKGFLHATAEFIVPLADHNITIPQLVYQKIAEDIKVVVNAKMQQIDK